MYHVNLNVNLIVESVIEIKIGISINVDASAENMAYVKKIIFWILLPVAVKYLGSIIYDSVITCDEIIDVEAKSHEEETKTVTTNFNEKNVICKAKKFQYFTFLFINYHYVINSCLYLLLPDKISIKTKTFIAILRHKWKVLC